MSYMMIDSERGYRNYLKNRYAMKIADIKPHENLQLDKWPHDGVIEFKQVYVRYRENLEPVLKGLTFII